MIDYSSTSCGSETGSNHSCTKPPGSAAVRSDGALGIEGLRLLRKLGSGDIGSVYLAELKYAVGCKYAAKVMDKEELVSRNKEERARREKEILEMLDHPFLPSLYASLESQRWVCLLTEFCPGGDLHLLRQRQKGERFDEPAVRFYASEVVAALEYIHMLGIVYRDLKPENVLVRSDGHIMLTDFDLSLKCDNPTSVAHIVSDPLSFATTSCAIPNCIVPAFSCFNVTLTRKHSKKPLRQGAPTFVAEPINVRSMSFVGTHEYLAPEIVSGEGHGSAVDWWTLGIFLYELSYGVTPFKGSDNEVTLANIVARGLEFPKDPTVVGSIKELIAALLVKNPAKRMGSTMGASAIKHHPFFYGVNWALLRCATPPYVPSFANRDVCDESYPDKLVEYY